MIVYCCSLVRIVDILLQSCTAYAIKSLPICTFHMLLVAKHRAVYQRKQALRILRHYSQTRKTRRRFLRTQIFAAQLRQHLHLWHSRVCRLRPFAAIDDIAERFYRAHRLHLHFTNWCRYATGISSLPPSKSYTSLQKALKHGKTRRRHHALLHWHHHTSHTLYVRDRLRHYLTDQLFQLSSLHQSQQVHPAQQSQKRPQPKLAASLSSSFTRLLRLQPISKLWQRWRFITSLRTHEQWHQLITRRHRLRRGWSMWRTFIPVENRTRQGQLHHLRTTLHRLRVQLQWQRHFHVDILTLARVHFRRRALHKVMQYLQQRRIYQKQLQRLIFRIRVHSYMTRWLTHLRRVEQQRVLVYRGRLRFQISKTTRVLRRWQRITTQEVRARLHTRVFRRLHTGTSSSLSLVTTCFHAWSRIFVAQRRREQQYIQLKTQQCRRTRLGLAFVLWRRSMAVREVQRCQLERLYVRWRERTRKSLVRKASLREKVMLAVAEETGVGREVRSRMGDRKRPGWSFAQWMKCLLDDASHGSDALIHAVSHHPHGKQLGLIRQRQRRSQLCFMRRLWKRWQEHMLLAQHQRAQQAHLHRDTSQRTAQIAHYLLHLRQQRRLDRCFRLWRRVVLCRRLLLRSVFVRHTGRRVFTQWKRRWEFEHMQRVLGITVTEPLPRRPPRSLPRPLPHPFARLHVPQRQHRLPIHSDEASLSLSNTFSVLSSFSSSVSPTISSSMSHLLLQQKRRVTATEGGLLSHRTKLRSISTSNNTSHMGHVSITSDTSTSKGTVANGITTSSSLKRGPVAVAAVAGYGDDHSAKNHPTLHHSFDHGYSRRHSGYHHDKENTHVSILEALPEDTSQDSLDTSLDHNHNDHGDQSNIDSRVSRAAQRGSVGKFTHALVQDTRRLQQEGGRSYLATYDSTKGSTSTTFL